MVLNGSAVISFDDPEEVLPPVYYEELYNAPAGNVTFFVY